MVSRVKSAASWGSHIGIWALFYTIIEFFVLFVVEMLYPVTGIDQRKIFDKETYEVDPLKYGNHKIRMTDYAKSYQKETNSTSDELSLVKVDVTTQPRDEELVLVPVKRSKRYELLQPTVPQVKRLLKVKTISKKKSHRVKASKRQASLEESQEELVSSDSSFVLCNRSSCETSE